MSDGKPVTVMKKKTDSDVKVSEKPVEKKKIEENENTKQEQTKMVTDNIVTNPSNSDGKKDEIKSTETPSNVEEEGGSLGKRKAEDNIDHDAKKKKQERQYVKFVPWQYLTPRVLKECIGFADPYIPPGKAAMVKITFDYNKFREICPECPEVRPIKNKILYSNHPFLKSSFGYSPHPGEDGKIVNQLRFEFDDYVSQEARRFRGEFNKEESKRMKQSADYEKEAQETLEKIKKDTDEKTKKELEDTANELKKKAKECAVEPFGVSGWDQFFTSAVLENQEKWSSKIKVLTKLVDKGDKVTLKDVARKWKSIAREPQSSSFANYFQLRLNTQQENPKQNIKEDPYTAFLPVWDNNEKQLAKKLTQKNSTDYDGNDAQILFDKGMYGSGVFSFDHINFTQESYGLTFTEEYLKIAHRDQVVVNDDDEEEAADDEACPI